MILLTNRVYVIAESMIMLKVTFLFYSVPQKESLQKASFCKTTGKCILSGTRGENI